MVSCCEIHHSRLLMCFHLISNIGPVSEKISNQGPSSTAADPLWVDIRFRETNEVIYLVGPQYSSFALYVHTFYRYGFDAEILLEKKKYQSAEWWHYLPFMLDSTPVFILIKAQTATSNNIRRSAKNKFVPGFLFSHVLWKTEGGSLQTDLISGKLNV